MDLSWGLWVALGFLDFCTLSSLDHQLLCLSLIRLCRQQIPLNGFVLTWMSQSRSSGSQDDAEFHLALSFEGLQVTVQGPKEKALALARRITTDLAEDQEKGYSSRGASSEPLVVPPRPADLCILAGKLSAASCLTPAERIKRAWVSGFHSIAQLDRRTPPVDEVVPIDLPSKFFPVVQGVGISEPRILRNVYDYRQALRQSSGTWLWGQNSLRRRKQAIVYLAAIKKR